MTLERIVNFHGAWDLTRPEPSRNYGIHSMEIRFAVKGQKGAVTMNVTTKWYLPQNISTAYRMYTKGYPFDGPKELMLPDITDIGYHSKQPQYSNQEPIGNCTLTDGPCYYDGTSLWGNEAWRLGFLHGGTDWLWPKLEDLYRHHFEGGPEVDLTPVPRKHPDESDA